MFVRVSPRICQLVVFFQCFVDRTVLNAVVQFEEFDNSRVVLVLRLMQCRAELGIRDFLQLC